MFTTKGPLIKLLNIVHDIQLIKNQEIDITCDILLNNSPLCLKCDYPQMTDSVKEGGTLIITNRHGLEIRFEITKVDKENKKLKLRSTNDGLQIIPSKFSANIYLPFVDIKLPTITSDDESKIQNFVLKEGVDIIAMSFVRTGKDISEMRDVLGPRGSFIKIIAKIDNYQALENFEKILSNADGVMIARGRLCYELPEEKLFMFQKVLIEKAKRAGKPVITSTQMLESMTYSPRPTLAEVTDVANAVIDGSDSILLSNETAKGLFPIQALETTVKICVEAEQCIHYLKSFESMRMRIFSDFYNVDNQDILTKSEVICKIAVTLAEDCNAGLIVVITETGTTVRLLAKYRPKQIILALCVSNSVIRQLKITRGVVSLKIPSFLGSENLIKQSILYAKENGFINIGDKVICILGEKEETPDYASTIKITHV
jgi:pyruvate kinase